MTLFWRLIFNNMYPESYSVMTVIFTFRSLTSPIAFWKLPFVNVCMNIVEMVKWVVFHSFLQPNNNIRKHMYIFFKLFNVYDIHWKWILSSSLLNPDFVHKLLWDILNVLMLLNFSFFCGEKPELEKGTVETKNNLLVSYFWNLFPHHMPLAWI